MEGLQVFDANGNVIVSMDTKITKVLGYGDTGISDGYIEDENLKYGGVWLIITERLSGDDDIDYSNIRYSRSYPHFKPYNADGKISWEFRHPGSLVYYWTHIRTKFIYGIY